MASILRGHDLISSLHITPKTFFMQMVTYKLGLPISTKNYNSLDLDEFLSNPYVLTCGCANLLFVNKYHNYIITTNSRIINNSSLRNSFCKGPKNRGNKSADLIRWVNLLF